MDERSNTRVVKEQKIMSDEKIDWEGNPIVVGEHGEVELWPVQDDKLSLLVLGHSNPKITEYAHIHLMGQTHISTDVVNQLINALLDYLAWKSKRQNTDE